MNNKVGTCRLLLGPMFAKKTTRLVEELNTLADIGWKCLYINYVDHNNRITVAGDKYISTHHSQFTGLHEFTDKITSSKLSDINIDSYDAIGIDEGQFFDDLNNIVRKWVFTNRKTVIVASLDSDSDMKPFGQAHDLECICDHDNIVRLTAFCSECLKTHILVNASFTKCITTKNGQTLTGGADMYKPVCMKCYMK